MVALGRVPVCQHFAVAETAMLLFRCFDPRSPILSPEAELAGAGQNNTFDKKGNSLHTAANTDSKSSSSKMIRGKRKRCEAA